VRLVFFSREEVGSARFAFERFGLAFRGTIARTSDSDPVRLPDAASFAGVDLK
jgi:hypothetical protein